MMLCPKAGCGKPPVRFDEGALKTGLWAGLRHRQRVKTAGKQRLPIPLRLPRQCPTLLNCRTARSGGSLRSGQANGEEFLWDGSRWSISRGPGQAVAFLPRGVPRPCSSLVRYQPLFLGLIESPSVARALEVAGQQQSAEDDAGLRKCSRRARGWQ